MPPGVAVAQHHTVVVAFAMDPQNTGQSVSCSDSKGNTYTLDVDNHFGDSASGVRTVICSARDLQTALGAGDTITVSHPRATHRVLTVQEFTGIVARDQITSANGNDAAPATGATSTRTQAVEALFGAIGVETAAGAVTFTAPAGWTKLTAAESGAISVFPVYRIVTTVGTDQASGTLGSTNKWAADLATYR